MIRSQQALLVSLSLHALMGVMLVFVVSPKILSPQEGEIRRCHIALSHVISVPAPALAPILETAEAFPQQTVAPRKKAPVKTVATPVKPKPVQEKKTERALRKAAQPVEEPRVRVETETVSDEAVQAETEAGERTASEQAVPSAETAAVAPPRQDGGSYLNEHLAIIAQLLRENLYYPKLARKRHLEGEVLAAFTLQTDGTIRDVTVKKHACDVLDRAAVRTIESLSGRLPHPQSTLTLEVPIRFVLK